MISRPGRGQTMVAAATGGRGRGPRGQLGTLQPLASHCPIPGCGEQIDPTRLMCRRDWYLVPRELRDQIWATWRSGQGAFTREHEAVVRQAITAVRQQRPESLPASSAAAGTS
jgi:hypothetical protein